MSGGSGGQMPMASNAGQQMQNPQMGMRPQGMMGGQMPPYQMAQQMPPQGFAFEDAFGGSPVDQSRMQAALQFSQNAQTGNMDPMSGQMSGGMPPYQMAQRMPSQGFDQFRQEEMMMGGMKPAMGAGIAALGGQMPMGAPMDYGTPRFPQQGIPTSAPPYQQTQSSMQPYMGSVDIKPTNMQKPEGMLPAGGMPPGFRPTSIDGRQLRDQIDITRPRSMRGDRDRETGQLPGAIENNLPPSLKRPTQGGYKNFK